jgi:vacuolar-type H+-ATPase subunit E/Vma4
MASASASPLGPNATVQATVRRWLELLASDQDERFLDEAIVPEQLDHILGTLSKADLVESFRKEKHETVVALLQGIRGKNPTTVREEGPDVLLTFASPPNQKTLTFVIRGSAVFIKD